MPLPICMRCCHQEAARLRYTCPYIPKGGIAVGSSFLQRAEPRVAFLKNPARTRSSLQAMHAHAEKPTGYRRNVGICLFNSSGLVFAGRRQNEQGDSWQMPQGGIDEEEDIFAAAKRELYEETGVSNARIVHVKEEWLTYDFPTSIRHLLSESVKQFKGQTQKWVLMVFHGTEAEINLDATGEREFADYRWMSLQEVAEHVVPFKAESYQSIVKEFGPLILQYKRQ